jgi:hypothetical protein
MRCSLRGYQHFGAACASVKGGGDVWPEDGRAHLCEIVEPASQTTQQHVSEHCNLDVPHRAIPKDVYCGFIGYSAALVQV